MNNEQRRNKLGESLVKLGLIVGLGSAGIMGYEIYSSIQQLKGAEQSLSIDQAKGNTARSSDDQVAIDGLVVEAALETVAGMGCAGLAAKSGYYLFYEPRRWEQLQREQEERES